MKCEKHGAMVRVCGEFRCGACYAEVMVAERVAHYAPGRHPGVGKVVYERDPHGHMGYRVERAG